MREIAVLLHNIRSAHNVGSMFRTADAAGVRSMYLSGYTPSPIDRFGRAQKEIAKTALGAEAALEWKYSSEPFALIERLRSDGFRIIGVEQHAQSIDYREFVYEGKLLFLFGEEVGGIAGELLAECDDVLEISMHGTKESLNVSVAAGIILFQAIST